MSSRGALQAHADPSVISCLHTLSRRIATVLQHEERRCQYLTREAKLILALQDEASATADGERAGGFSRHGGGWALCWTGHALGTQQDPQSSQRDPRSQTDTLGVAPQPKMFPSPRPHMMALPAGQVPPWSCWAVSLGWGACGRAASSWKEASSLLSAEVKGSPIEWSADQLLKVVSADRPARGLGALSAFQS